MCEKSDQHQQFSAVGSPKVLYYNTKRASRPSNTGHTILFSNDLFDFSLWKNQTIKFYYAGYTETKLIPNVEWSNHNETFENSVISVCSYEQVLKFKTEIQLKSNIPKNISGLIDNTSFSTEFIRAGKV